MKSKREKNSPNPSPNQSVNQNQDQKLSLTTGYTTNRSGYVLLPIEVKDIIKEDSREHSYLRESQ